MNKKIIALIASLILAVGVVGAEKFSNSPYPNPLPQGEREQAEVYDTSRIWSRGPTGNAAENATNHFKKHGAEFGFKSEQEYVAAAVKFSTEPLADGVLKNIQKDGDTAFYNPKTAEYAVKSRRGFIRTYFKLNPQIHGYASNTDYFNAQAKVGSQPPANDNSP
jgi:hypothetical protein